MATSRTERRRSSLTLAAGIFVALVAALGWRAWVVTRDADEQATRLAARLAVPPPPPPPPGPAAPPAGSDADLPLGQIISSRAPAVAPPLHLPTADGKRFDLAGARGQVVFVNFWATWCPPCAREMPSMVRLGAALAARHPGKFRMVAVSVDESPADVAAFFAKPPFHGLPKGVTIALDPEAGPTTRSFYCVGRGACGPDDVKFPESYIVGADGRIAAYVIGDRDWDDPAASAYLESLIGKG